MTRPTRHGRRIPEWLTDWRTARSILTAWWYSATALELRAAYVDARRAPGIVVAGMVAVCWPLSGFSWIPVAVAVVAAWVTLRLTRRLWWRTRIRVRRWSYPVIGLGALVTLVIEAGPRAWLLSIGLWLITAGLTDTIRARRRLTDWLIQHLARTTRTDIEEWRTGSAEWDGRTLLNAELRFGNSVRAEEPAVRERVTQAVSWSLRHSGRYNVEWPAGTSSAVIRALPILPTHVDEQHWPDLPGIVIGVTDAETADGVVETIDAETKETITSHPVALIDPGDAERHYLVAGGTGAGKSVWCRGFISRGILKGWWPGGVYLFDGKAGSDFIPFENRQGVHCVARTPEEWAEWLPRIVAVMTNRYEEDAEYERGRRGKPDSPRYLVVFDEIQQIRASLGHETFDPLIQQIARQIRASNGRLLVATQRPDADDAIPGAVRDMLEDRIILGFLSAIGARMMLDHEWRAATDEYGAQTVPGRGIARIGGRIIRIQTPYLPRLRQHPQAAPLYPPMREKDAPDPAPSQAATARWAPTAPEDTGEADQGPQNATQGPTSTAGGIEVPPEEDTGRTRRKTI